MSNNSYKSQCSYYTFKQLSISIILFSPWSQDLRSRLPEVKRQPRNCWSYVPSTPFKSKWEKQLNILTYLMIGHLSELKSGVPATLLRACLTKKSFRTVSSTSEIHLAIILKQSWKDITSHIKEVPMMQWWVSLEIQIENGRNTQTSGQTNK